MEAGGNPCFKNFHPPVRGHDVTNVSRQDTAWEGPWGCLGLFGAVWAVWGCLGLSLGPLRGQPQHSQGQPQVAAKADIGDILFSTQLLNDPSKNCKKIKGWSETRKGEIPLSSTQKFGNASEKDSRLLIQERTTTFFLASSLKKMSCHTDVSTLVFR